MAANVLNSPMAVEMSVFVVRAFVRMRREMLSRVELEKRLEQLEMTLLVHDDALKDLYEKIRPLLLPPPKREKKKLGFHVEESRSNYRSKRSRKKAARH